MFYVKCKKTKIHATFKVKFTAKCKKCGFLRIFCNCLKMISFCFLYAKGLYCLL